MSKPGVNEAAQYFEGIFTVDHDGIVIVDHDGIILRVNPAFIKIFGYEEHEILGKPFYILAYKSQKMQKITSHNSLHRFCCSENASMEMTLFDKQGHDILVRFRSVLIRDKHDQIKQAIGMIEHMVELTGTGEGESSLAEKMWEAQQNFENVLNNSADAIIICDISGNIMMANKAFSQMLDYNQEEVIGKHIVEFTAFEKGTYITSTGEEVIIDEEYVTNTASSSAKLFEKGCVSNWESYLVKKDKVHVPAEITMSVLKDMDGERRGSLVILRNITERKKTEVETKKARNFLENIFKTSVDGIMVTNKGVITMVNEAIEKMTGYSKDEIIGKRTFELAPEGKVYQEEGKEFIEKLFEEGTVVGEEMTWLKKDGSLLDVEVNAALLKDDKGNIIAVSSIRDITERKISEKEIKEARDFLESVIENSKDGILIVNEKGYILSCNSAMEQMSGFSKEEMLGKHASTLTIENKEMKKKILEKTAELFEKGVASYGSTFKSKDGKYIDVECISSMVKNEKGDYVAGVSILRDITKRKEMEHKLLQSEKLKSLGELAGGVAHDFNNVLAVILGRAQLLKMNVEPPTG